MPYRTFMSGVSTTTRADWVAAGLELLRDGGEDAVTVDRLCATLGRTKGSFYHHFEDSAAYQGALLEHWANLHTELPIAAAGRLHVHAARALHRRRDPRRPVTGARSQRI